MAEHEVFETRLRAALARHVADAPPDIDALAFARSVAAAAPRHRGRLGAIATALDARRADRRPWWSTLVPSVGWSPALRVAWAVVLVGLLLAASVSAVFVGSQLLRRTSVPTVVQPPNAERDSRALEPLGEPVVAETALGTISWQMYGDYLQGMVGTPHGPVTIGAADLLQGAHLVWLDSGGDLHGAALPEEMWGLLPVGDGLIAYGSAQGYGRGRAWPISWDGRRWVVGDELDVPPSLFGSQATEVRVAAGPRGVLIVGYDVAVAADGQHFVAATQRPGGNDRLTVKVGPILATDEGFVALVAAGQSQFDDGPVFAPTPWFSVDGLTWEPPAAASPFGAGARVSDVAARDGRFVAVGERGTAWATWVSDDGRTWELLPEFGLDGNRSCAPCPIGVTASDAGWVISTGKHQSLWASADGRTWEPLAVPAVSIDEPWGFLPEVALSDDTIVVVGWLDPAGTASVVGSIEP
jgi:hypothetical protein